MGTCNCFTTTQKESPRHTIATNDIEVIEHINASPSPPPNLYKSSIFSVASTSATTYNSPTSIHTNSCTDVQIIHPAIAINDTNLKTLTTNNTIYNAIVTRPRDLTNTSNASTSTNYSSLEQLYVITSENLAQTNTTDTTQIHSSNSECKPLKSSQIEIITTLPSISTLSKLSQPKLAKLPIQKHLPNPSNTSKSKSIKSINTASTKRISHSGSYVSHNVMMFISNSTPPETPPNQSPVLSSQLSGQSISSNNRSSFTLTNHSNNFNMTYSHTAMAQLTERTESSLTVTMTDNKSCKCGAVEDNILDINTLPSIWCIDHDDMLGYMLVSWHIPIDLFSIFKSYIYMDGYDILTNVDGEYHKRIRNALLLTSFCPCWYHLFADIPLRIMQFGYCPGTTQFALKFTNNNQNQNNKMKFESRSRFSRNICIANQLLTIEIFDMNIAEFPTMIPSYLECYDPHVILLLFDVADRSSFEGIIKMRKSLENLYESLSEKCEYDIAIHPNRNNLNLKRFHDSFDAIASVFGFGDKSERETIKTLKTARSNSIASVFGFGNKSERETIKTRSSSVASMLSNISNGIKKECKYLKSKSIDVYDRKASKFKVNESNKNEFTIQALSKEEEEDECGSCYYHNNNICSDTTTSRMPPILVIGIHADIDDTQRNVSIEEGLQLSKKWEVPYIETSAINGNNVNDVFIECVRTRWLYDTYPTVRHRSRAFIIT